MVDLAGVLESAAGGAPIELAPLPEHARHRRRRPPPRARRRRSERAHLQFHTRTKYYAFLNEANEGMRPLLELQVAGTGIARVLMTVRSMSTIQLLASYS